MTKLEKLIDLYQKMSDMTASECKQCRVPHSCCSPEYCDLATERAKELGVELTPTGHERLPYMVDGVGCTVPPYLRPSCTMHTCDISGLGFKRSDLTGKWTDDYFDLRDQINSLEYEMRKDK